MDIRTTAATGVCVLAVVVGLTAPSALADSKGPNDPAPPAPTGVPHLSSPQNLPPGTTTDPADPPQNTELTYLQELWNAVQTQNVSLKDAIMLLAQRPLDQDQSPGPVAGPQP